ncbi:MAG: ACP S-malonyltransferase, partial [Omnitrophica bacterium]|nr:ACP S-malonyltransferase [Candidatus Omnitrophota bacterium]
CQVAVFTVSVASLKALEAQGVEIDLKFTAGLSLGEYTALVAAGALKFAQGLTLVSKRAQYMEQASCQNPGGMVSIIGLPLNAVEKICQEAKVEISNLNCPGQVVISGNHQGLEKAKKIAVASGAKRTIPLKVSGGFHSSLIAPASQKLAQALEEAEICPTEIPVVSNVTAKEERAPSEIKNNLIRQLVSRTLWEDSISFISSSGIKNFIEIGPGKVLKGLVRKIDPALKVHSIGTIEELRQFRKEQSL